jgi:hypothetical protein
MKNSILIVFIIFYLNLSATIINVPADQPTIQAGINVAVDSDTVLVQPGTYNENIDFNGHRITVGSLFLTTADSSHIPLTVIDGGSSGSVISFQSGEDSTTVLTGFTIQNGFNWDGGGGILCNSSDPVIINNIIKDNLADSGGGIKCSSSNAKIINNIIHNNSFVSVLGNPGGGICCINGSDCIIMFNIIHHNQNQDGGGIASFDSDPIISNNVIYENEAWDLGGGMRCLNSNAIIINNTFWGNTSTEAGGIYVDYGCNLTIVNNILWNNSPNEITGNVTVTYSDIEGGYAGIGNIDSDPLLVNPQNSNFQLDLNSPCIDTGTPDTTGLNLPPWDIIGNYRIWDGDGDGTAIIDMGAYEYGAEPYVEATQNQIPNTQYQLTNYPNPFNPSGAGRSPSTTISFSIPDKSKIELSIYNIKGEKVKQLLSNSAFQLSAGQHSVVWNGRYSNGNRVSSGIYFYKMKINGKTEAVKKCLLLK